MASFRMGLESEDMADLNGANGLNGILDMLGFDLIKDNMFKQIHNQTESTYDYLSALKDKFNAVIEEDELDSDDRSNVKYEMIDFCEGIIQAIVGEYDLLPNIISDDYASMLHVVEVLYNFLILNRCQHVERFLITYIETNKTPLINSINIDDGVKDISTLSGKKKNFSREVIAILSYISEIIDFIKHSNVIECDEFLGTINDGDYYTSQMIELYAEGTLYGNFVPKILHTVLGEEYDGNEATRIRNSIRAHFYTSAPESTPVGDCDDDVTE